MVCRIHFSLVHYANNPTARMFLFGSRLELGNWTSDKAIRLETDPSVSHREPRFWRTTVEISAEVGEKVHYRFICKTTADDGSEVVEMEGQDGYCREIGVAEVDTTKDAPHLLAPAYWQYLDASTTELTKTAYFGQTVLEPNQLLHLAQIRHDLYLGSSPRKREHLNYLQRLGVTAVLTLQTGEDLCEYDKLGISFVWLPARDNQPVDRKRMLPHAALIIQSLLVNGHTVYVHCNSGVVRSPSALCGYLHLVERMPMDELHYLVASRRPMVWFDRQAIEETRGDFQRKFGVVSDMCRHRQMMS